MIRKNIKLRLLGSVITLALAATILSPNAAKADDATSTGYNIFENSFDGGLLDPHRFQVRLRGIGVIPDESATVSIGGSVKATNEYVPEVDFTYFLTDHFALELIAATSRHSITATAGSGIDLGDVWALPPTLTLQYHPFDEGLFRPYVGAGLNYTIFYAADEGPGFTDIDYDNSFGPALQVGADFALDDNWRLNFDVKKIWMNTDVTIQPGGITADVDLDPWVVGFGIGYRF